MGHGIGKVEAVCNILGIGAFNGPAFLYQKCIQLVVADETGQTGPDRWAGQR